MISPETVFGGYADTIIKILEEYNRLEVHGVSEEPDGSGGFVCEVNDDDPQFFSVYAHLKEGGADCIGDFQTHVDAQAYALIISTQYNWPIDSD